MTDNNQRVNEQAAWTGAGGGAPHCSWCYKIRTTCTCGSLRAAIEQRASSAPDVRPLVGPKMAEYLRGQPWISAYIETLECELRKARARQAAPEAPAAASVVDLEDLANQYLGTLDDDENVELYATNRVLALGEIRPFLDFVALAQQSTKEAR